MNVIELINVSCGYGKNNKIIHNVNVCFKKNKVNVILGPNGCGKTTLLKAIAGLIKINEGDIFVNDKRSSEYNSNTLAKLISFMPQMRHVPAMLVRDYIMCARYPYLGISKQPQDSDFLAVDEAMEIVGVTAFKDRPLKKLSGGERQKVYFAFMLAQQTDILLLDEPTTYLDAAKQFELLDLIKDMKENQKKKTVVMVMHDICHGLKAADNIIVMNEGQIIFSGTPTQVLDEGILEKIYNIKIHRLVIEDNEEYVISK